MTTAAVQTGKRKAYPTYKPSGVEWLGNVPEHWEIWKITHGFDRLGSGTTPKSDKLDYYDGDIPWVTTSELREKLIEDTRNKLTAEALLDYSGLRIYPAGTLLFAMYGATIGRMGILGIPAAVNQACAAFIGPKHLTPEFTFYWLLMRRPTLIALSAGGGQPNLSQDDLRLVRIPAPPPTEQKAIAAFLDRETARIDALIEKKQRQIKLLQEKRAALISHAVTKGLNPNAPMKDSGVEWLGRVPQHWQICRLKHYVDLLPGYAFSSTGFTDQADDVRLLRGINVSPGRVDWSDAVRWPSADTEAFARYRLKVGDIVFGMDRPWIGSGIRVAQLTRGDVPSLLLQRVARLRTKYLGVIL